MHRDVVGDLFQRYRGAVLPGESGHLPAVRGVVNWLSVAFLGLSELDVGGECALVVVGETRPRPLATVSIEGFQLLLECDHGRSRSKRAEVELSRAAERAELSLEYLRRQVPAGPERQALHHGGDLVGLVVGLLAQQGLVAVVDGLHEAVNVAGLLLEGRVEILGALAVRRLFHAGARDAQRQATDVMLLRDQLVDVRR